jgi:hypothetical protein
MSRYCVIAPIIKIGSLTMVAVLYDNHHPKGHHRHLEGREETGSWMSTA